MRHRLSAIWLVVAALLMKVIVPVGFMPAIADGRITIEPCSGFGVEKMAMTMPEMAPGMADHHGGHTPSDKNDMPCGFAGHAPASLASADPVLLAIAIAFIVTAVFRRPVPRPIRRLGYLRPHLRGPPAIA